MGSGKSAKSGKSVKSGGKTAGKGKSTALLTPEEEAAAALVAEEEARRAAAEAKALAAEADFVEAMIAEALERAVAEVGAEAEEERQAFITAKLLEKGKVAVEGRVRCVVGGEVAEVRAFDPKEGRYIAQLPNKKLVKVHPSQITRLREPPAPPDDVTVVSKYSSLKNW